MSYRQTILTSGPVAFWELTEALSIEYDLVNNIPAVKNGTPVKRSTLYPLQNGVDLRATGDYYRVSPANMTDIYWNSTDYSAEWFCYADSVGQDAFFSQRTNSDATDQGLSVFVGSTGDRSVVCDMGASGTRNYFSAYQVPPNTYLHCVFTYTHATKTRKLYIDGVNVATDVGAVTTSPQTVPPMTIGLLGGNQTYSWDGVICNISFYKKTLSDAEIRDHFLASGALGYTMVSGGALIRRPVKRLDGATTKYVPVRKKP